jgi:hypothetical protein
MKKKARCACTVSNVSRKFEPVGDGWEKRAGFLYRFVNGSMRIICESGLNDWEKKKRGGEEEDNYFVPF